MNRRVKELDKFFTEKFNEVNNRAYRVGSIGGLDRMEKLLDRWPSITEADLLLVILWAKSEWSGDPVMDPYNQPSTLLKHGSGKQSRHFADYLSIAEEWFARKTMKDAVPPKASRKARSPHS